MYCYNCGKEIVDNAKFCSHCGSSVAQYAQGMSKQKLSQVKETRVHSHTEELYFEGRTGDVFIAAMGAVATALVVYAFVTL